MAKSKKNKPSFESPAGEAGGGAAPWVYRSDAAPADERAAPKAAGAARAAAPPPPPADPIAQPAVTVTRDRAKAGQRLVDRYAKYAAAAGLVPLPIVDLAAIAGVQVAMLNALASEYDVPFSRARGKALVAALLGGLMPSLAGHQVLKVIGPLVGMISVSGFAVASTQAVGRVFIAHFESGGTLLDVDIERSRQQLAAQLRPAAQP